MGRIASRSAARNVLPAAACAAALGLMAAAWAQELVFTAEIDKTTVELGDPLTLSITLTGDFEGVQLPTPEFPEGFAVSGQSQSTNFSLRAGVMERAITLTYVLIPQRSGTFQLGPFALTYQDTELTTEPIEITVKTPTTAPSIQPEGGRFTL